MLSDIEKQKIESFCADEIMFEAVKKVLLAGIYDNGVLEEGKPAEPRKNFALSLVLGGGEFTDEHIGRVLRAQGEGIRTVETGFTKLKEVKLEKSKNPDKPVNPAL